MKDTLDPFESAYSGVQWSALDDATIEGDFLQTPLRQAKARRCLRVRMTQISVLEHWGGSVGRAVARPEQKLSGRGELSEVLTVFELNGGPLRRFQDVREITIVPSLVTADTGCRQPDDAKGGDASEPSGVLFVEFEALRIHGQHPEPTLQLRLTMEADEFQRVYALLNDRTDEIKDVILTLDADLFGDDWEGDEYRPEGVPEYGMLRSTYEPSACALTCLKRIDVTLGRSRSTLNLTSEPHLPATPLVWTAQGTNQSSIIVKQLGWIITLLIVIIIILLSSSGSSGNSNTERKYRKFAEIGWLVQLNIL